MIRKIIFFCLFLIFAGNSRSQIVNKEPLSQRLTGYRIDATLDPLAKTVSGKMEAFWVNNSTDNVPDIQMHMYLNAFRSNKTTLYKEKGGSPGSQKIDLGWININSITDREGRSLVSGMDFISPDDGNDDDMSVLQIILPEPVKPGDTVFLKVDFESKLPSSIMRTGFNDDFFFVAQWFPKFGVYEKEGMIKGAWNCHQFHANSEFYSNHSVFDVNITVPEEFIVGSGGLFIKEVISEKSKTLTYRAEDIVDFAWTAWPGYAVYEDKWRNVAITFLGPPERKDQAGRQLQAVKNALEYLDEKVGPYPWPHLTFVDPPAKGNGAGGMEYTTLFTSQSAYGIPDYIHFPEMVTIHEFGHAYFMGILASNEFEEPWLDEGVNTFWEERIVDHYYGENSGIVNHPLLKISDKSLSRLAYVSSENRQVVSNSEYSWNYPHGTYGMMSYNKTGTILYTLMGITGEETIDEVFREYYKKWAFRHPSGKDFINIVNEVVVRKHGNKYGADMNWFFDQTIYGTGVVDYKVSGIKNTRVSSYTGLSLENDSLIFIPGKIGRDSIYNTVVQLERTGEIMLPVEVLIHFDNDESIIEKWDGKARFKDFRFTGSRKADWVKIDPEYKIRMDVNFTNNSYTVEPDKIPVRSFTSKLISFMQFFITFISL
jgi:hypothetical protein